VIAVVASTVGWPALELAVFWLRFHRLPPAGAAEALVFVPMGFVAGVAAAVLMARATSERQSRAVVWGYAAASPLALLGALLGGLVLQGVWGPLVFGALPLAAGCLIGFLVSKQEA
jgi:zinc transporter ZupT